MTRWYLLVELREESVMMTPKRGKKMQNYRAAPHPSLLAS